MNDAAAAWVVSAVCPWLALLLAVQRLIAWRGMALRGWALLIASGVIALGVLLIPIDRIALARWVASLSPSFSVPLTGLLAITAWERAFSRQVLSSRDRTTGWMFGAIAGLLLYPFALGVSRIDPYVWGWSASPLFIVIGVLTGWLIWRGNRFGLLLLLAVVAFRLQIFESTNYWDYLVDPIYCLASLVVLGTRMYVASGFSRTGYASTTISHD
jgi:hypothetical protein